MKTDPNIDKQLAESVRIALRDFGAGILVEERLMGILKDYQAFQHFSAAEYIVRTLIADGTVSRLYSVTGNDNVIFQDYLFREISKLNLQYGFSQVYLQRILFSFISGFGYPTDDIRTENNKNDKANQSPSKRPQPPHTPGSTQNPHSPNKPTGTPKKNPPASLSIKWNLIIFLVLPVTVSFLAYHGIANYKRNYNQEEHYQTVKEVTIDEQTDTISTAPDQTDSYRQRKTKPYPKGRWRESTDSKEYESEYEDGYEEGRYGRARVPRSYGEDDAYESGYEEGLADRKAR